MTHPKLLLFPGLIRYVEKLHVCRYTALFKMVEFTRHVGTYWLKDDHDTLANDTWPGRKVGELTFAEAAAQFSDAPSKDRGGDVGYFPRRGVMHEAFAAAAFALKPGEVSQPVVTPFGVHLIQITAEKPGSKQLADVREEVYRAAEARLFDTLVANGRKRAKVEYAAK